MWSGCGTALVTPFRADLSLDEAAMRRLVRRQIDAGINFLVPCGTTGENPTLSHEETLRVVAITVEEARGRVPVLAGCGGYNTAEIISMAKELEALHIDGILSVTPYYNKPTQEGLYRHFRAIAAAISIPVILYNVGRRTAVNIEPATMKRLAQVENIAGVKEASGDMSQIATILGQAADDFVVFSGDDSLALPTIALGGRGLISVASNEIPGQMTQLVQLCLQGDFAGARILQRKYLALMEVNFVESNPIPVKAAMAAMGLLEPVWRLPLCAPKPQNEEAIRGVLETYGLLEGRHVAGASRGTV